MSVFSNQPANHFNANHFNASTVRRLALAASFLLALTSCSAVDAVTGSSTDESAFSTNTTATDGSSDTDTSGNTGAETDGSGTALWDSSFVHDIDIEFDQDDYDEMILTYETTEEKDWIVVTATIDGVTYENVGLRLKGNSSLRSVSLETAQNPEELHWLIRLDKYVDGQTHQDYSDIVIRSNSTETAINEAVAVELLAEADLASQEAIATTLSFNGGGTELRLAMQNPDEIWEEENFAADTYSLYKAESTGDYSYRGDDEDAYDEVFDLEAGVDDFEPLTGFLDFINNSDDATFATELGDHLDVESFATYLAFQDLIDNFDDIDGPGNNSYLHYDYDTELFTVVNWDLNLAFGTANLDGGGQGAGGNAIGGGAGRPQRPDAAGGGAPAAEGGAPAADGGAPAAGGGGRGGDNILVNRFLADDDFAALYDAAMASLTNDLFADGTADEIITVWTSVLESQTIVDIATINADADAVTSAFPTA